MTFKKYTQKEAARAIDRFLEAHGVQYSFINAEDVDIKKDAEGAIIFSATYLNGFESYEIHGFIDDVITRPTICTIYKRWQEAETYDKNGSPAKIVNKLDIIYDDRLESIKINSRHF